MPSLAPRFPPKPDFGTWSLGSDDVRVTCPKVGRMSILVGPRDAELPVNHIRWPESAAAEPYAVRISPWKTFVVGELAVPEAFGEIDATGLWQLFDIVGPRAMEVVRQGGEIGGPSPSAARLVAGRACLLYHAGSSETLRLHVPRARSAEMALWLQEAVERVSTAV